MPDNNSLIWIVIALFIIFEVEILFLGTYWLIKNHRRRDKLDEMRRKKKSRNTYSLAPALLFTLPTIFNDFRFQVGAIVILVAAIFFVTIFHLHCLWKREEDEAHALQSTDELDEETYTDDNVSIAVEQEFALEVEENHPLSIKIPICELSVDEEADAEHGLIVDSAKHEPVKPVPVMNWRGELTRRIWPILITNCRGEEIGEIQPIIVETRDDDLVKPIRPLKVDNSKGMESQPLVATRIKNQRGETVGFIKPIVVENVGGKLVGSAKAPIVMNEAEEIIGVARPIVVIDSGGTVLGTVAPSITYDREKDSHMQSVVLFHANGEVSIPLRSVAVTDVKDMSDVVLPKVIVSNAEEDQEVMTGEEFIVTKSSSPERAKVNEEREEKAEGSGARSDNTAAAKAEKAAARKAVKTDKAAAREIAETAQEQEPIAEQPYGQDNDEPEYVDEIEYVSPAASPVKARERARERAPMPAPAPERRTVVTQERVQKQTLQFDPAAKRQAQPVAAKAVRQPAPATVQATAPAPAKTSVQTGYAQDPDDVYEGDIEEVRVTNDSTGEVTVIRYNKSFTAKLIQSSDEIKAWYGRLKNEFLSYDRVWSRVWWSHDNVNVSRIGIAKFVIEEGKLYVYMALNPNDFSRQFGVKGADRPRYKKVPCVICIQSDRDVDTAIKLIAALAKKFGVTRGETKIENYYLPYETTEALLAENLMQEIYRETTKRVTAKAS